MADPEANASVAVDMAAPVEPQENGGKPRKVTASEDVGLSAFHFKAIIVAGMGFFTDAYDLFSISLMTRLIGRIYYQDNPYTYIASNYLTGPAQTAYTVAGAKGNPADALAPWWGVSQNGIPQPYGPNFQYFANGSTASLPLGPGVGGAPAGFLGATVATSNGVPNGYQVLMPVTQTVSVANGTLGALYGAPTSGFGVNALQTVTTLQPFGAYNKGRVKPGRLPINLDAAVSGVALCGTLAGQLFFGWAGDRFGRKVVYGATLMVMCFCAAAQSMSFGTNGAAVVGTLCFWRFFLGFGVGGDYPLSATIMSEYSSRLSRGAFVSAVFAMQGVGILTAAAVSIIVTASFNSYYPSLPFPADDMSSNPALYWQLIQQSCPKQADFVWRIVLGFGFFPAACTWYLRATMPETPRAQMRAMREAAVARRLAREAAASSAAAAAEGDPSAVAASSLQVADARDMNFRTFIRRHARELIGCAVTWFMLDVAFYSQNLFQKDVFTQIGWLPPGESLNAMTETFKLARAQALIALGSTIPGYYFTVALVDTLGRIKIQIIGFALMTTFMAALAGGYNGLLNPNNDFATGLNQRQPTRRSGFVTMYALAFFFANFGPNATTFVIPAELFPTKWKATGHGFSAAAGKAGAIIGAFGFLYASQPAKNEVAWKFPCVNSPLFEYISFATGNNQFIVTNVAAYTAAASAYVVGSPATANAANAGWAKQATNALTGATVQITSYFQNIAVPGTVLQPTSAGTLVQAPTSLKVSNVLSANPAISLAYAQSVYLDAVNLAAPGSCSVCFGAGVCQTGVDCTSPDQIWFANPVNGIYPNASGVAFLGSGGVNGSATAQTTADPTAGIANTNTYSFPQIGIDGKNIQTIASLPFNTSACLVKPNCPGGLIGTPAVNNGKESYQCVCPIPTPLGGCYPYGIGIQGALGVLAATNFLGLLFTLLLPETNGKTLEQLNGETDAVKASGEEDFDAEFWDSQYGELNPVLAVGGGAPVAA